jgi:4a-hydroxytetrahydrobiopterin dehydratase
MNWHEENGALTRTFVFPNQTTLAKFVLEMASIADEMNHHPDFEVTKVSTLLISIRTHSENRITEKDSRLANRIDLIA